LAYPILDGVPLVVEELPLHRRIYNPLLAADITWDDFAWLVGSAGVPVIPKGILRADDARRAEDVGAAAVIVSNHGARNLDTVPATADVLSAIVDAVNVPVLVDGGIRRGTDVAKAMALGATAVMIGRPYIWGLATHGAAGVQRVVEILHTELRMAMALLGAPQLCDLTPDLLTAGRDRPDSAGRTAP
jgi:4-hydroxymandelate oxidase